jgi:hypothetical protein
MCFLPFSLCRDLLCKMNRARCAFSGQVSNPYLTPQDNYMSPFLSGDCVAIRHFHWTPLRLHSGW